MFPSCRGLSVEGGCLTGLLPRHPKFSLSVPHFQQSHTELVLRGCWNKCLFVPLHLITPLYPVSLTCLPSPLCSCTPHSHTPVPFTNPIVPVSPHLYLTPLHQGPLTVHPCILGASRHSHGTSLVPLCRPCMPKTTARLAPGMQWASVGPDTLLPGGWWKEGRS